MNTSANINVSSVNGALTQNKIESREKANNSDTDSDTLKELSTHEDFYVRRAVATHYNTPTTALSSLASDAEEQIRFYLAANPNTPAETLTQLAFDESGDVRSQVAGNSNTPIDILQELAKDIYIETQRQLVENPNTVASVLEKIGVSFIELAELKALSSQEAAVIRGISMNSNTPSCVLERICAIKNQDNHYWLFELGIAKNCNASHTLLQKLATHADYDVRFAVANNFNTPDFVLNTLTQ
ncbi:leucine rich repeat variant [Calothrix sp. NIES-4071]|nr:leucine rich repeat variant [Calothrix sp. NIES-4071]BAZ56780.1 leucine rich repeat variant [Calothrix sp. NIES-4105]